MDNQTSNPHLTDDNLISEPNKFEEPSYEQNLRKSILKIHNDSSLTSVQKAKRVQVKIMF